MRATPVVSFCCWNEFFYDCRWYTVKRRRLLRNSRYLSVGSDSLHLQFKTYNLSSKLPTQAHQLHYSASRTSFCDTITSYRKTAVVLKLSSLTFAEFFTSTAKI